MYYCNKTITTYFLFNVFKMYFKSAYITFILVNTTLNFI